MHKITCNFQIYLVGTSSKHSWIRLKRSLRLPKHWIAERSTGHLPLSYSETPADEDNFAAHQAPRPTYVLVQSTTSIPLQIFRAPRIAVRTLQSATWEADLDDYYLPWEPQIFLDPFGTVGKQPRLSSNKTHETL